MTEADVPAVDALEKALFPVDAWPTYMFYDELSQPDTRTYYVAVDALGTVIGYAGVMCIPPIADVQTIAVVPEREGQGIGTALLTTLIGQARAFGARDVLLEVRADNPRAQRLYRWFGFTQIHVRPRYYRDGTDAVIMQLVLDGWTGVPGQPGTATQASRETTEETQ